MKKYFCIDYDFTEMNFYSKVEALKRYSILCLALFVMTFGTSLAIRANLGSAPIACPPYVLSCIEGQSLTFGTLTFILHLIFVFAQYLLLRGDLKTKILRQIPLSLCFGFFTDLTMWLTKSFQWDNSVEGYAVRVLQLVVGTTLIGIGVSVQVRCRTLLLAGEGMISAIARIMKKEYGKVKIFCDIFLVLIGLIFSFLFFGFWRFDMIGFGTLFSAVYVGFVVRFVAKHTPWLETFFATDTVAEDPLVFETKEINTLPLVITIARMHGSGGHEIGQKVAERLGIKFYDKEIINKTAETLGISKKDVEDKDQFISNASFLEYIITDNGISKEKFSGRDGAIFLEQSRIIKEAAMESCVIIGRCADYILKDRPCCLNIFIRSNEDFAVKMVTGRTQLSENQAREVIRIKNRARANHYEKYTGLQWQNPDHYDIVINTAKIGIDTSVDLICNAVKVFFER
ncbi:MAG: cytidylate kinase family protein [Bacteroidales bacterium]|nr:cytidylate kinase family protein [Bacteroidales bacterium]